MTPAEHAREVVAVRASLMLAGTRADRRDGPVRRIAAPIAAPIAPVAPAHVFVVPIVTERPL